MASVGHINATLFGLYDGSSLVGYATDVQFERNRETIEVTTKDSSGNMEVIPGKMSFSGSANFLFREDATFGYNDLMTKISAGTAITAKWSTEVSGDSYETGSVYLTNLTRGGSHESTFEASCSVQGTGALTISTVA